MRTEYKRKLEDLVYCYNKITRFDKEKKYLKVCTLEQFNTDCAHIEKQKNKKMWKQLDLTYDPSNNECIVLIDYHKLTWRYIPVWALLEIFEIEVKDMINYIWEVILNDKK